MAENRYTDRFRRLEIPQDKRRVDWAFLEKPLALPQPLPMAEQGLAVWLNGRAFVPNDDAGGPNDPVLRLYDREHRLLERDPPGKAEAIYHYHHDKELHRLKKSVSSSVPTKLIREPSLLREALAQLGETLPPQGEVPEQAKAVAVHAPGELAASSEASVFVREFLGFGRILRIHDKIYDLVTLAEYAAIFDKAIDRALFRKLQKLTDTAGPNEYLTLIEENLELVHSKARSPLRNKMTSSAVRFNQVTLLPIYITDVAAFFEAYRAAWDRRIKLDALTAMCAA